MSQRISFGEPAQRVQPLTRVLRHASQDGEPRDSDSSAMQACLNVLPEDSVRKSRNVFKHVKHVHAAFVTGNL